MVLRYDHSPIQSFVAPHEWQAIEAAVSAASDALKSRSGLGAQYTGWLFARRQAQEERTRMMDVVARMRSLCDAVVVIGIGGSYAGIRATLDVLGHAYQSVGRADGARFASVHRASGPDVFFAGYHISSVALTQLLDVLEHRSFGIVVISKSGTTTEPAIAFRILKQRLEQRYGKEGARTRIVVTTDAHTGALRSHAAEAGYDTFVVPADVGGRYSVLTSVGLVPLAIAGIDIEAMQDGASDAMEAYRLSSGMDDPSAQYAAVRNIVHRKGKTIELLATTEPSMWAFGEWWKQLFGESEGKDGKGLFPATVQYTTDLHSMGQYVQDGPRLMLQTVVAFAPQPNALVVPADVDVHDGLDGCVGMTLDEINAQALYGTVIAHADGGVPTTIVHVQERTPYAIGQLVTFFHIACAISGYVVGVNPFDQPGVEAYKRNMLALLGKPGLEAERAYVQEQLRRWGLQ
jgi:glucose-6-phosphate isomerase